MTTKIAIVTGGSRGAGRNVVAPGLVATDFSGGGVI